MKKNKILPLLTFMLLLSVNSCYSSDGYVGMVIDKGHDGYPKILKVLPNSSAQKLGLYQQDRILKINGIDTRNFSTEDVSSMLRGDSGTTVNVLVDNLGEQKEISLLRLARVDCGIEIKKDLNNSVEITKIYKNSGAALSELMIGDKIISIDEQSVINLDEKNIKNLLYGFENAQKQITFTRNGQEKVAIIALKDYQITQEEAQQILSDFEKEGYNIAYAIKNGRYDVVDAYIKTGNTITFDMFEYALAYNQYDIANLMAKQNIDMVSDSNKPKKDLSGMRKAAGGLVMVGSAFANALPLGGIIGGALLSDYEPNTGSEKRPKIEAELRLIKKQYAQNGNPFVLKAVESNNINILNVFIKAKYDLDLALAHATYTKKNIIAKVLIENGANFNTTIRNPRYNGFTAFTYAVGSGNLELVKFMIEHGADVNTPINSGGSKVIKPIDLAIMYKQTEMIDLLRSYGAEL